MRFAVWVLALALIVGLVFAQSPCTSNANCRASTCVNGKCVRRTGLGMVCDDSGDCDPRHSCVGGQCVITCPGQENCGTRDNPECTTVSSDNNNCGRCDNVCASGKSCIGGQCVCNSGTSNCNNDCIDITSDANNCGFCNNRCGQDARCQSSLCGCDDGYGNCFNDYAFDGCETSLISNDNHCGACNNNCGQSASCSGTSCQCISSAYGNCDSNYNSNGCETFLPSDDTYCGGCGTGRNCGGSPGSSNSYCQSGSCRCENPSNYGNCDNNYGNGCETNIRTSDGYCGGCGANRACGGTGATDSTCNNGACACSNPNYGNCDNNYNGNGCETNLLTSDAYCGGCGANRACGGSPGSPFDSTCEDGTCECSTTNYENCDNNYGNGCETAILSDDTYCGGCGSGRNCGGSPGSSFDSVCDNGACRCALPIYGNCDNNYNSNGCETPLYSDDTYCGACGTGRNCGGSDGTDSYCQSGSCRCDNPTNYGNCDNDYTNGCETNILTSNTYCGGCGANRACGSSSSCVNGVCTCAQNFGSCDFNPGNGCETNLLTNDFYCGSCGFGYTCGGNGATDSTCNNGACGCSNPNYGNCDNNYNFNGCETNLLTSDTYCGACGIGENCGGSGNYNSYCSQGSCECEYAGYYNCDDDFTDGCESYVPTDDDNCGACGTACNDNSYCRFSVCNCEMYYDDCNDMLDDGCEVDLRTDDEYCGGCAEGNSCGGIGDTDSECVDGSCECVNTSYRDCNDNYDDDGCETFVMGNDSSNCGACGFACQSGVCSNGICSTR